MPGQDFRRWSPAPPCREYARFAEVAEEVLARLSSQTTREQFAKAQQSLLFLYQERKTRLDPWHFRFPGGHPCLDECYLHYTTRLGLCFLLPPPPPPPPAEPKPPTPRPPGATPQEVVTNLRTLAEVLHRPRGTYLGRETLPP